MKILRLAAENFKRLKAIDISPDGNVVRITGRNGQGKSSALDAIWAALGGEKSSPPMPIRQGEKAAEVQIDLGEFKVRRRWTASGSSIDVSTESAAFKSPQKLLDSLIGKLSFDPLEFAEKDPAAQRADLLGLLGIGAKLAEIDTERKVAFETRTQVNRDLKGLEAQLLATPTVEAPAEEVSVTALMEELKAARNLAGQKDAKGLAVQQIAQRSEAVTLRIQTANDRIKELQNEIARMDNVIAEGLKTQAEFLEQTKKLNAEAAAINVPDLSAIEGRIAGAEGTNAKVRQAKARKDLEAKLVAKRTSAESLTTSIEAAEKKKTDLVAASALPVKDLGFSDAGVTFKGVPLEQCAASERLKVSVAVAMALNPRLKVILVRDASLLDSKNLKMIEDLAAARDFQLWIEQVDESGKVGVYIEDGAVVAVDGEPVEAPAPQPEAKSA